jgi:hypothetical protein
MAPSRCPNCGMEFLSETSVLKHMNHRHSSCKLFFLRGDPLPTGFSTPPHTPSALPDPPSRSHDFPDAGRVYGRGEGFMGWFGSDVYAAERVSNEYYPFESKGEWELASFLSQSGLSMKRIDEFLSLNMVRSSLTTRGSDTDDMARSPASAFPFIVPGRYVAASSCCRAAHPGNPQLYPFPGIQRRTHSSYIIETLSSVPSFSSGIHYSQTISNTPPEWSMTQVGDVNTMNG